MSSPYRTLGFVAAVALLASACNDDITCIFTTGCQDGDGPISENEAILPIDGDWIVDGPPEVDGFFPTGAQNPGTTPVVIVFSESMQPESLADAIDIVPLIGGGIPGQPVADIAEALVADGRVLVLLPPVATELEAGDYQVRLSETAALLDITGQELDAGADGQLGVFTISDSPPDAPRLVATFPADEAENQGEDTQIVVVFDRPVEEQSVDGLSFDVRVDDVDPPSDPVAQPIVAEAGSGSREDTRAFLWRSLGSDGRPASLGIGVDVELRLSPSTDPIVDEDDDRLAFSTIQFTTLAFSPPIDGVLLSDPPDAIGRANLTDGDPEELEIEVRLADGQPDDFIDLFVFGRQRSDEPDPPLVALQSSVRLSGTAPIQTALFTREVINLQSSDSPDDVRFEEGAITFAFRMRRGSVVSPVRVLDLDPDPDTIQDVLLDTVVPEVTDLFGGPPDEEETDSFRSEQRGLSLAGTAGERLRTVEVTTPLDDNDARPVAGSTESAFLAAPVPLGLVAGGGTTYTFVARDEALNTSAPLDGAFTQLGALGPTPYAPGDSIEVEVFDARSLLPLQNARVSVHSDHGNGIDFPHFQTALTLADGKVTLATGGAPSVAAIVTVELAMYDLFTLHGVPSTRLSIPLARSNQGRARADGIVTTTDPAADALLPNLDRRYDDSRRSTELPRGFIGSSCLTPDGETCVERYGPEGIDDNEPGARSFYAGDFSQPEAAFSPAQLVQAFALTLPFAPLPSNAPPQPGILEVPSLLIDASTPPEETAQPVPAFTFEVAAESGVDLLDLFDDLATTGSPHVGVEVLIPGLPGSIGVAQGLAYDQGGDRWTIRAAYPGAIGPAGSLGSAGAIDTDPFVRVEVVDLAGNAAGVRPRLSTLQAAGPGPVLRALAVARQLSPAPGGASGGQEFTLLLSHAIGAARTEAGLYRVELRDVNGRVWTLWRSDPPGTADVQVRVVDLVPLGGTGLADSIQMVSTVVTYASSSFNPLDFMWTDVEREFELFSRAEPITFSKP